MSEIVYVAMSEEEAEKFPGEMSRAVLVKGVDKRQVRVNSLDPVNAFFGGVAFGAFLQWIFMVSI